MECLPALQHPQRAVAMTDRARAWPQTAIKLDCISTLETPSIAWQLQRLRASISASPVRLLSPLDQVQQVVLEQAQRAPAVRNFSFLLRAHLAEGLMPSRQRCVRPSKK